MRRFEIIDFLKGFSIFTIMIFHYLSFLPPPDPFDKLIYFGGTGVHLFILLSGFGLYYSHMSKPVTYITFLKKRISKIYIPYIVIVLISALIALLLPVYNNSLYAVLGHVFLFKMFDENIMGSYGYQLWFISMILQFYLTFYFIIWLKSKLKNKLFLISGLVISLCWAVLVYVLHKGNERIWNSFFLQFYWEFALGMVVAEKVFQKQKLTGENSNQLVLLTIGIINCALYGFIALKGGEWGQLFNDVFALTGYSLLAIFLYKLKLKPVNQLFLFIGKISLSVYLLHILVLLTAANLFHNLNSLYIIAISLLIIFPLSVLYQKMIDKFFKIIKI